MRRPIIRVSWLLGLILALVVLATLTRPYVKAVSFVVRSAGQQKTYPRLASLAVQPYSERDRQVPTRFGPARARTYVPDRTIERAVLLVPGVNALAIDEPRLVGFARALAESGLAVVTPEVDDLKGYRVTPRCTDVIEDAAGWLAAQPDLAIGRPVGIIGISFAGGLSIVAAGRPSLRGRVAWVFSFGGHGDFRRVVEYLCTGLETAIEPGDLAASRTRAGGRGDAVRRPTRHRAPHDYSLAVIVYGAADLLVPADQAGPLRAAVLTFLEASHLALYDRKGADREFARARDLEAALPMPAQHVMRLVNTRAVAETGQLLLPHLGTLADDPAVSPDKSPAPSAPVFMLHGTDDNVVPAVETLLLAEYLQEKTEVRWLLSPLISHAEIDRRAPAGEIWALIRLWAAILTA